MPDGHHVPPRHQWQGMSPHACRRCSRQGGDATKENEPSPNQHRQQRASASIISAPLQYRLSNTASPIPAAPIHKTLLPPFSPRKATRGKGHPTLHQRQPPVSKTHIVQRREVASSHSLLQGALARAGLSQEVYRGASRLHPSGQDGSRVVQRRRELRTRKYIYIRLEGRLSENRSRGEQDWKTVLQEDASM